ncbi:hypothetical protein F444_17326 [Phytophthora nicotianae P1976]|uniref:Uncharacterized protein n=1 Tax=Phytophthora nicotianae P1976 TaxID=1317066 RepID=A0A080ZFC6_PHYNI|nr:hypothetical protein F444_17326 [Phytophthora nicotianae P1976]
MIGKHSEDVAIFLGHHANSSIVFAILEGVRLQFEQQECGLQKKLGVAGVVTTPQCWHVADTWQQWMIELQAVVVWQYQFGRTLVDSISTLASWVCTRNGKMLECSDEFEADVCTWGFVIFKTASTVRMLRRRNFRWELLLVATTRLYMTVVTRTDSAHARRGTSCSLPNCRSNLYSSAENPVAPRGWYHRVGVGA